MEWNGDMAEPKEEKVRRLIPICLIGKFNCILFRLAFIPCTYSDLLSLLLFLSYSPTPFDPTKKPQVFKPMAHPLLLSFR